MADEQLGDALRHAMVQVLESEIKAIGDKMQKDVCRNIRHYIERQHSLATTRSDFEQRNLQGRGQGPVEPGSKVAELIERNQAARRKILDRRRQRTESNHSEPLNVQLSNNSKPVTPKSDPGGVEKADSFECASAETVSPEEVNDDRTGKNVEEDIGLHRAACGDGNVQTLPGVTEDAPLPPQITHIEPAASRNSSKLTANGTGGDHDTNGSIDQSIVKTFDTPRGEDDGDSVDLVVRTQTTATSRMRKSMVFATGEEDECQDEEEKPDWRDINALRERLITFIKGEYFDYIMGSFLALNAIFMGAQVEVIAQPTPDLGAVDTFQSLDWCFACIFLSELILRVFAGGGQFFYDKWNVGDVLIVMLHFMELIINMVGTDGVSGVDNLGMLRIVRLGRLARLVRMVRLIPELKSMVYLLTASMASFVWAVFLLVVVMYAFAIYFTEMALDIRTGAPEHAESVTGKWGSIWSSMLSLYMAISGGDDWHVMMLPLTYTSSVYATLNQLIFLTYVAFATFVMLNLVTGVFVEGAQRIIREEQDNDISRMAAKAFTSADSDMSAEISWNEYNASLHSKHMIEYCRAVGITMLEAYDLFEILDVDKNESLSVSEFVKGCLKLRAQSTRMDVAQLKHRVEKDAEMLKTEFEAMTLLLQQHMKRVERTLPQSEPPSPKQRCHSKVEQMVEEV